MSSLNCSPLPNHNWWTHSNLLSSSPLPYTSLVPTLTTYRRMGPWRWLLCTGTGFAMGIKVSYFRASVCSPRTLGPLGGMASSWAPNFLLQVSAELSD